MTKVEASGEPYDDLHQEAVYKGKNRCKKAVVQSVEVVPVVEERVSNKNDNSTLSEIVRNEA